MNKIVVITVYADNQGNLKNLNFERSKVQDHLIKYNEENANSLIHRIVINATNEDFINELDNNIGNIYLLSYSGHSKGKYLGTADKTSDGAKLAGKLKNCQIVLLNGCENNELADFFLEAGIKVVITTPLPVDDDKAVIFANTFFNLFFNKGQMVKEAFNGAILSVESTNKQNIKSIVRGLGKEEEIDNSTWVLGFLDEEYLNLKVGDSLTKETKVEKPNFKLSLPENADKLSILCLYDEESKELYNGIRDYLSENQDRYPDWLINGLWEINEEGLVWENIKTEYEAADYILHLLNDTVYKNTIEKSNIDKIIEAVPRDHIYIIKKGKGDSFERKKWFDKNEIIKPVIDLLGETFDEIKNSLIRASKDSSASVIFDKCFSNNFNQKIYKKKNPDLVKKAIKSIPFIEVYDKYRNTDEVIFFYTLVESTLFCAELLIINQVIKFKRLLSNTQIIKIPFQSEKIDSSEALWQSVLKELKIKPKFSINKSSDLEKCIDNIFERIATENLIISFEQVPNNELFETEIIEKFWGEMKKAYPVARKMNPNINIDGKLFIFVFNNNIDKEKFKKIEENTEFSIALSVSPVSSFRKDDYHLWTELTANFPECTFEELMPDQGPNYRKKILIKFCEKIEFKGLIPQLDKDILNL